MAKYLSEGTISLQADLTEVMSVFAGYGYEINRRYIQRSILKSAGQGGRTYVRRRYRSVLKRDTSNLFKSISYYVPRGASMIVFNANANSGKNTSKDGRIAKYGYMLASGYTVKPKNGKKVMAFQRNGKWVRFKEYTVKPKDFMEAPLMRYADSSDMRNRIEKATQKQVDRVEAKYGEGKW